MPDVAFDELPLGTLFRLSVKPVFPALEPTSEFHHHSLPAWDATGAPAIERGSSIESNKVLLDEPAVLVSKLNPRKPRVAVVQPRPGERHCASTEFMCFVPRNQDEDLDYWAYYLGSSSFSARLQRVAIGSTNSHTRASPSEVIRWTVPNPPYPQKRAIAQILDTLDTTIRQTEAIIEKLKQVKQGLLHDLLTRGIDANGELRPPQSQAPHLYKDSPLGWIPREWKAVRFADAGTVTLGRQSAPRYQRGVNTRPYLRVVNILEDRLDLRDVKTMDFDPTDFQRFCLRPGDVLLTEGDLASAHTVGRSAVYGGEVDGCCFQNTLIRFRPAQPEHSDYFHFAFCHLRATGRFAAVTTATTVHHLSAGRLEREVFLPLAPAPERLEVARRLRAIEHLVDVESRGLGKHAVLKSGLMDDLLTGRIRVTPLLA